MQIQFSDFIVPGALVPDLAATSKVEVLAEMIDALVEAGALRAEQRPHAVQALVARERICTTAINGSVAIPHGKHPGVHQLVGMVGRSLAGIPFEAEDGIPVHLFFLLLSNQNESSRHLEALAHISRCVRDDLFKRFLLNARSANEMMHVLSTADQQPYGAGLA